MCVTGYKSMSRCLTFLLSLHVTAQNCDVTVRSDNQSYRRGVGGGAKYAVIGGLRSGGPQHETWVTSCKSIFEGTAAGFIARVPLCDQHSSEERNALTPSRRLPAADLGTTRCAKQLPLSPQPAGTAVVTLGGKTPVKLPQKSLHFSSRIRLETLLIWMRFHDSGRCAGHAWFPLLLCGDGTEVCDLCPRKVEPWSRILKMSAISEQRSRARR